MRERGSPEPSRLFKVCVIAVLAALVGFIVLVVRNAKGETKIKEARRQIRDLVSAIESYESKYDAPPVCQEAKNSVTAKCPDLTFGTINRVSAGKNPFLTNNRGEKLFPTFSRENNGYQNSNAEVIAILLDLLKFRNGDPTVNTDHARNSDHVVFLKAKQASDAISPGIGTDGVYRDPWGNPYIITFDMNGDGRCRDALYRIQTVSSFRSGATGFNGLRNYLDPGGFTSDFEAKVSVMVWSYGPDGKADHNPADRPPNKDNVLSWK